MKATPATRTFSALLLAVASGGALGCRCGGEPTERDAGDRADAPTVLDAPTPLDAPAPDTAAVDATNLDTPATDAAAIDATNLDAPAPDDARGCAPGTSSTNLPALSVAFPPQRCVYTLAEAAAGIVLAYEVNVAASVTIEQMLNCETAGPSGAVVGEAIGGGGQRYCVCDTGLCFPTTITPTLAPGSYADTLEWNGLNWDGPSDTGMPFGPPFPPGDYLFDVRITGTSGGAAFTVTGALPIRLVP